MDKNLKLSSSELRSDWKHLEFMSNGSFQNNLISLVNNTNHNEIEKIKCNVRYGFKKLSPQFLKELDEKFLQKSIIISITSVDMACCYIYWKPKGIDNFLMTSIENLEAEIVREFLEEFICNSLKKGYSGILPNQDTENEISLHSFGDSRNYNLLHIACESGNHKVTKYLLKIGIYPDLLESEITAQDLAWSGRHYDVLLILLNADFPFPNNFNVSECSNEIQNFVKQNETLHKIALAKEDNLNEMMKIIEMAPARRYFYNIKNESLLKVVLDNKLYSVYEALLSMNLLFAPHENISKIVESLDHEIENPIHEDHINVLLSNTYISHNEINDRRLKNNLIRKAYYHLNKNSTLKKILTIVAATKIFRIYFDFKENTISKTFTNTVIGAKGTSFVSGRIYIAAKNLHDPKTEQDALGVIAHELCHYAIQVTYNNNLNPFNIDDKKTKVHFEEICQKCKMKKEKDPIINSVFIDYESELIYPELIVRPAHMMAFYSCKPEILQEQEKIFDELFNYFKNFIIPAIEEATIKFNIKHVYVKITADNLTKIGVLHFLLGHDDVKNRNIIVLTVAAENGDEFHFYAIIKFLYDNYNSLKMKEKSNKSIHYECKYEDNQLLKKEFSINNNEKSEDFIIWEDVFLDENVETGEEFGLLVIFTRNAKKDLKGSKIFTFLSLITSIYIVVLVITLSSTSKSYKNQLKNIQFDISKHDGPSLFLTSDKINKRFNFSIGQKYLKQSKFYKILKKMFKKVSCTLVPGHENNYGNETKNDFKKALSPIIGKKRLKKNIIKNTMSSHDLFERFQNANTDFGLFNNMKIFYDDSVFKNVDQFLEDEPGCSSNNLRKIKDFSNLTESKDQEKDDNRSDEFENEYDSNIDSDSDVDDIDQPRSCKFEPYKNEIRPIIFNQRKKENKKIYNEPHNEYMETDDLQRRLEVAIPKYNYNIFDLNEDIYVSIMEHLTDEEKLNIIYSSERFVKIFSVSRTILKNFTVSINMNNFESLSTYSGILSIPLINIEINSEGFKDKNELFKFLINYKGSVENLTVKNTTFKTFQDFSVVCESLSKIKTISLEKCAIQIIDKHNVLNPKQTLLKISFNKCNENIFKAFVNQKSLKKISVQNDDWTWNGFAHEIFNKIAENCLQLDEIEFKGAGTGSFFDFDEFRFKIRKLDTTMITFHWYVGIRSQRIGFLESQKGFLKELIIHQLPNDFDGGRVLKYIIEDMDLDNFYYGKMPLILNKQKQEICEFEATEIQIQASFEMFRQFRSIRCFRLILSMTDISSDDIERIVNSHTQLFERLEKFEVVDNSKYRGTFGVFLGLMKNMRNLKTLILRTLDRNINVLLEESIRYMPRLEKIYLTSNAPRVNDRFMIIKHLVPNLTEISVISQFVPEAKQIFGESLVREIMEN